MKKLFAFKLFLPILVLGALSSCGKDDDDIINTAKLSATHASPGSPNVDIYIDGAKVTNAQLSYPGTTGVSGNPYLDVNAGIRNVKVSPNGILNVIDANLLLEANKSYSVFAYDVLGSGTTIKVLFLSDNLKLPDTGKAHIRFLHLAPGAPAVDIEFAKTGSASIDLANIPYVGVSPNATALSTFTPIDAGPYTVNIRATGTTAVVLGVPITFTAGKIYTIYARGLMSNGVGTALGLNASVITHN